MKLSIIGGGTMGEAVLSGVLRQAVAAPGDVTVSDVAQARLDHLRQTYGVGVTNDNPAAVRGAEIIVIAVKPQHLAETMASVRGCFEAKQMALSIVAGATIRTLTSGLGHQAVIRAMPNTPGQIGQGVTAWMATPAVDQGQRDAAVSVMSALGKAVELTDENLLDVATALSGSGPAYVFLFIEALIEAGVYLGMSRELATELTVQTVRGSGTMAIESNLGPAALREQVTSPGGTTAEALLALEEGGFRSTVMSAVVAAYEKAKLLGKEG